MWAKNTPIQSADDLTRKSVRYRRANSHWTRFCTSPFSTSSFSYTMRRSKSFVIGLHLTRQRTRSSDLEAEACVRSRLTRITSSTRPWLNMTSKRPSSAWPPKTSSHLTCTRSHLRMKRKDTASWHSHSRHSTMISRSGGMPSRLSSTCEILKADHGLPSRRTALINSCRIWSRCTFWTRWPRRCYSFAPIKPAKPWVYWRVLQRPASSSWKKILRLLNRQSSTLSALSILQSVIKPRRASNPHLSSWLTRWRSRRECQATRWSKVRCRRKLKLRSSWFELKTKRYRMRSSGTPKVSALLTITSSISTRQRSR